MAEAKEHPKAAQVREVAEHLTKAKVVGLASIEGIPALQMQQIRARLRGTVDFRIVKNRLLLRALATAAPEREGLQGLEAFIVGPTALVTTEHNPFRLYRELEATKTQAPARGGEVAPEDIVVRAGDTPFKPGPVVGDLQKAGVPAAIERGKVVIKQDKVLVEAGRRIPPQVAQVLTRMEILPLTVGLDLRGVIEDGQLYTPEHLGVDEAALRGDLATAASQAYLLALRAAYPTEGTTEPLLARAREEALALAWVVEYPASEVLPRLLSQAHSEMTALAARVPGALGEGPRTRDEDSEEGAKPSKKPGPQEEAETTDTKKEKEGEKEAAEEDAAAGLSSLFG